MANNRRAEDVNDPKHEAVSAIIADEKAHHDHAVAAALAGSFWPRVLMPIVSASTEAVIWLGMRL